MQQAMKEKLEKVVELVNNVLVDPDIAIDYYIPEEITRNGVHDTTSGDPYVLLKYIVNGTHETEQKIPIKPNYLEKTPEDLANLVTFYIEQFMEEIHTVEHGYE
ncbi:MAG TPA: hypothetical protein VLL31_03875 [Sulfurovum sp.]|nr:hypothetical protein [Sulfurovum sp.]